MNEHPANPTPPATEPDSPSAPTGIPETQALIVEKFELLPTTMQRYVYLIELGKTLPEFPLLWQLERHRVPGCQSNVWFKELSEGPEFRFRAFSDSAIVCGFIALLELTFSKHPAADVVREPLTFAESIGLGAQFSATRQNGLARLVEFIKERAALRLDEPPS